MFKEYCGWHRRCSVKGGAPSGGPYELYKAAAARCRCIYHCVTGTWHRAGCSRECKRKPEPGGEVVVVIHVRESSAVTAQVTRSYNSSDTFEPGPLGYGWRMGGLQLGVDAINQGSGEYDEAQIKLPDGREIKS